MSSEALKDCPFCHAPAFSAPDDENGWLVGCVSARADCAVQPSVGAANEAEAIAAWNRRATPSPASGELASLVERLNKGADSASWTEALDLLRLAASQLAAVAAERDALREAVKKISAIRDSIIGFQNVGWSEHIYPLVAALHDAGFDGVGYDKARENVSTLLDTTKAAEARALTAERLLAEAREALTQIASGRDKDGNTVDFFQDIAGEALVTLSPGGSNGQG